MFNKGADTITFTSPLTASELTVNGNTTVNANLSIGGQITTTNTINCTTLTATNGDVSATGRFTRANNTRPYARYNTPTVGALSGSYGIVNYANAIYDTHNAVTTGTTWKFTVPTGCSGYYHITAALHINAAGWIAIFLNGTLHVRFAQASAGYMCNGSFIMYLTEGQYIDIRANTTGINTTADVNWISIGCLELA